MTKPGGQVSARRFFRNMENILTYKNGTRLFTDSSEMPSMAPLILAAFAMPAVPKHMAEFCSGNGCCTFWMADRGFRGSADLVDMRRGALSLAERTISENELESIKTCCADITSFRAEHPYQLIVCNPPFFSEKDVARDSDRSAVRHENGLTPDALCCSAAANLRQRGHFCVCYIPQRLTDMLLSMRKYQLEPKKIRFCRHSAGREPFLVLIDAIFMGGQGLSILPDLFVKGENGEYTEEMLNICEGGSDV